MRIHLAVLHTRWQGSWPTHTGSGTPCHPTGLGFDTTMSKRCVTCKHCRAWIRAHPGLTRVNRGPANRYPSPRRGPRSQPLARKTARRTG